MTLPISDPRARVLMLALDDWISLAEVVSVVQRTLPPVEGDLRSATLATLEDLVRRGLLIAGDLSPRFTPWALDAQRTLEVIDGGWTIDPEEIDQGHGCWFDLTPAGEVLGKRLAEERRGQRQA